MRCFARVHLTDGQEIEGVWIDVTDAELGQMKTTVAEIVNAAPNGGASINLDTTGGWHVIPARSIFYVELVIEDGDE